MRRRRRSHGEWEDEKLYKSRGEEKITLEPDVSEVRRIRVERLEGSTSTRRSVATPKMTSESHATLPGLKSTSSHRRRKGPQRSTVSTKHRTRRKSNSNDDSTPTYVYGPSADRSQTSRNTISETRKLGRDEESSASEEDEDEENHTTHSGPVREKPKRKIRVVYVKENSLKSTKPKERRVKSYKETRDRPKDSSESVRRSRVHTSRRKSVAEERPVSPPKRYVQTILALLMLTSSLRRSVSTRDLPSEARPSLRRSATTNSHIPTIKSPYDPSLTGTTATIKRSSFLGSFFGPAVQHHHEPERLYGRVAPDCCAKLTVFQG